MSEARTSTKTENTAYKTAARDLFIISEVMCVSIVLISLSVLTVIESGVIMGVLNSVVLTLYFAMPLVTLTAFIALPFMLLWRPQRKWKVLLVGFLIAMASPAIIAFILWYSDGLGNWYY